ncbi:unnamed protein product [Toxocara canis]|uniref:CRAL-TRIO domain-containing protein F28H7.8 n=1 Tax=Toxocara canis TaxID=6265 RepID=A0A183UF05_TOXCA|nr:unnamed protein product [Toxocara canis]
MPSLEVRNAVRDEIHPNYDTEFNILRYCQSCEFNASKTIYMLKKHLRFRAEYNLDEGECTLRGEAWLEEYAPWTILGPNRGHDADHVVVIEQGGQIDSHGLLKSVEITSYMHQRYRRMEKIYSIMQQLERETGRQCYAYFIFDLNGLHFDPTLIPVMTGPFRNAWYEAGLHYRQWIDRVFVVNAPTFMSILWSAMAPLISEDMKRRIVFTSGNGADELLARIDSDRLPKMYGGQMNDDVVLPPKRIPKQMYWKLRSDYPNPKALIPLSIPAGKKRTLSFEVKEPCKVHFYLIAHHQITLSLTYTQDNINYDTTSVETIASECTRVGLPSMDYFTHLLTSSGHYHLHLMNDASWLLPITVKYLILSHNQYKPQNVIPVTASAAVSKTKKQENVKR